MKKCFILVIFVIFIIIFSGCGQSQMTSLQDKVSSNPTENAVFTDSDREKAENIVNALAGSLMLGFSWDKISGEEYKYDLSLTSFYCILNPNFPKEIPAIEFETFIQKYFDISAIDLREIDGYSEENETYVVSVDVSVDRANRQTEEYFRIDQIDYNDGQIKVLYHAVWGKMAPYEDMQNSVVFAGYVFLDKENDYRIIKVELTEDNFSQ